jgi:transposase InsO family protein
MTLVLNLLWVYLSPLERKILFRLFVDRLTKTAHFIEVHTTYSVQQYVESYMDQIVHLHGIPKTIVSDRGTQYVHRFWEQLHECLGTKLIRSSSYHPQTDGQTEKVNQILEDMLRASIFHFDKRELGQVFVLGRVLL